MSTPIADALILVFTQGVSLREWQETGMLAREWALYRALLPSYRKIVLVTYGRADDEAVLASVLTPPERGRVTLVCNAQGLAPANYVGGLPQRLASETAGLSTVVIKTNQMQGGDVALRLVEAMRGQGKVAALVARGGYLWTRFVAHEHGPHSQAAVEAAAREKALCTGADAVVGTTQDMVQDLAWRYGLDPSRTAVIPNYVLTDQPPMPASERERGYVLYAGQLIARKRVDLLIEAMSLLPEESRLATRLEVVGDGVERAKLEALAAKLKAPVTFTKRVPHNELLNKMRRCGIYVQTSELEGHPKTVLEAMASGAPVIVANSPGMEVVHHGLTGLRLDPEARLIAHAISELQADEDWRQALGSAAANAVRAAFGLPRIVEQELVMHQRALAGARSRTAMAA
jgi:hypothetical protein